MMTTRRHPGTANLLVAALSVAGLLLAAAVASADEPGSPDWPQGPVSQSTPGLGQMPGTPGMDPATAWSQPPQLASPRGNGPRSTLLYDNGAPLDDYGDPSSQLSGPPAQPLWQFISAAADDFELVDQVSPDTSYQIALVRAAFTFYNIPSGTTPSPLLTWEGVDVVVYANAPQNWPNERPTQAGGHTNYNGGPVAEQFVPAASLLNETQIGTCNPGFQVDIPVDLVLAKNTKYWLSLIPRFPAPPQTGWCLSTQANLGYSAMQGASFGITFWTAITGNVGCPNAYNCPAACDGVPNPPANTDKELSFQLYGGELPPNYGACCDQVAGTCADVSDTTQCPGTYQVFHPGTLCRFLDPPCNAPVTGACCNDSTGICVSNVRIDLCPEGPDQRFVPGAACAALNPPCGAGLGACCFPDQHCEDLAPAACANLGGLWNTGTCATHTCPPPNDACANAPLIYGDVFGYFSTAGATTDGPSVSGTDCANVGQDIWFRYVPMCTGTLAVSLCFGTNYDSSIALYEGCACPVTSAMQIGCNNDGCGGGSGASFMTAPVIAGNCYTIRIGGNGSATGQGYLAITCMPPASGGCCLPLGGCVTMIQTDCTAAGGVFHAGQACSPMLCPPPNDGCTDAIQIPDGVRPFATWGATTDGPPITEPDCVTVNQDIWYDYQASADGDLIVSLCLDTRFDAALAVYDGWGCPPGALVGCNNDACAPGGPAALMVPSVTAGHLYKIRVGGAGLAVGTGNLIVGVVPASQGACCLANGQCIETDQAGCTGAGGTFHADQPCSPLTCPPPNDLCANAMPITGGRYEFDTRGALTDGPEDSPGGYCTNVHHDLWFKYTADCTGTLVASVCGEVNYDAALAVYSGCTCPPTALIGCDDNSCGQAAVAFANVTNGACYLIRVGGAGDATGTGVLTVACLPPGTGACCHADYTCESTLASACIEPGDVFTPGQPCTPETCAAPPLPDCCPGDTNADGLINGNDIGSFVQIMLSQPALGTMDFCRANVDDADYILDMSDVEAFVSKLLAGTPCSTVPTGACCQANGGCQVRTAAQCASQGGVYAGSGTVCFPNPCPQPGACCSSDGSCQVLLPAACSAAGGIYQGGGTTCAPDLCPQPGACCLPDGTCQVLQPAACGTAQGTYQGAATSCTPNPCPPLCCLGDLNGDNRLDLLDVAVFVSALLDPPAGGSTAFCRADVNGDLAVDGRDIDAFTQRLLAGASCPPPVNDTCASAQLIAANGLISLDNTLATTAADDPPFSCRLAGPAQGVGTLWFKFEATDTSARIDTCNSVAPVTDTLVAVYAGTGTCPFVVTDELGCEDDSCGQLSRLCVNGLTPGVTYFIQVASQDDGSRGLVTVQVTSPCPQ